MKLVQKVLPEDPVLLEPQALLEPKAKKDRQVVWEPTPSTVPAQLVIVLMLELMLIETSHTENIKKFIKSI